MDRAPCVALSAPTGSGKTTQVPRLIHSAGRGGKTVVLQPRRLAARAVARRVAAEMGVELGGLVGFQTRHERCLSASTEIVFVTDGLFLRQMLAPRALAGIDTVVLDEFHERNIAMDLVAGLVRRGQVNGSKVRLLAMSATLDASAVAEALDAPLVEASGRQYEVEVRYAGDGAANGPPVWERAAAALGEEWGAGTEGDALIFMPGKGEIERCMECCRGALAQRRIDADILPLHGSLEAEQQDRAIALSRRRKVIVATNIAEASITVPGIRLVIDGGLARVARFDSQRDLNALRLEPISVANATQRAGRAGRTASGRCVRLWSESAQARMVAHEPPEIVRTELAEALLILRGCGVVRAELFPWITDPPALALERAEQTLRQIGATQADGTLTAVGRAMLRVGAHPRLARALYAATDAQRGRVARWCALMSGRDIVRPGANLKAVLERDDPSCDMVARERMLEAFDSGRRVDGLDADAAREALRTARELTASTRDWASPEPNDATQTSDPAQAFLSAYPDRVAWRPEALRDAALMNGRKKLVLDRTSIARAAGPVLALEVRESAGGDRSTSLISIGVPLQRRWVEEALGDQFATRVEERWEARTQSVVEVEELCFGEIAIEKTERPPRDIARASLELAARVHAGEVALPEWSAACEQWIVRVRCAAQWRPDDELTAFADADLLRCRQEICAGCVRAKELVGRDCLGVLHAALSPPQRRSVDRLAPESVALPNGRRLRLVYELGKPPRGAARIQDFYGLADSPTVNEGRLRVTLEILGPNQRPLQVTQDLAGFWKTLYPQLRPELQRRYPRHEWR